MHEALDQMLATARAENERMRETMGEMGVSPRPTVAQWLRGKQQQRKRAVQDALINWDRSVTAWDNIFLTAGTSKYISYTTAQNFQLLPTGKLSQKVIAGEPQVVVFAVFPLKRHSIMRNSLY